MCKCTYVEVRIYTWKTKKKNERKSKGKTTRKRERRRTRRKGRGQKIVGRNEGQEVNGAEGEIVGEMKGKRKMGWRGRKIVGERQRTKGKMDGGTENSERNEGQEERGGVGK